MAATYWQPDSEWLTPQQKLTLAVPALVKPRREQFLGLWLDRLMALSSNPSEALAQQQLMSEAERLSDQWYSLRLSQQSPTSLVPLTAHQCESLMSLMSRVQWLRPGQQVEPPTQTLAEVIAMLD
jgi:hypothetical protein